MSGKPRNTRGPNKGLYLGDIEATTPSDDLEARFVFGDLIASKRTELWAVMQDLHNLEQRKAEPPELVEAGLSDVLLVSESVPQVFLKPFADALARGDAGFFRAIAELIERGQHAEPVNELHLALQTARDWGFIRRDADGQPIATQRELEDAYGAMKDKCKLTTPLPDRKTVKAAAERLGITIEKVK